MKVLAGWVLVRTPLLGSQMAAFLLCPCAPNSEGAPVSEGHGSVRSGSLLLTFNPGYVCKCSVSRGCPPGALPAPPLAFADRDRGHLVPIQASSSPLQGGGCPVTVHAACLPPLGSMG